MITLYDVGPLVIDGKESGFSPFVRRIMYILNYKRLPYQVKLLRYEDIEPTAKSVGAPPTALRADGITPRYTVPFLVDSTTNTAVSDSILIAEYLDTAYPSSPQTTPKATQVLVDTIFQKFRPLYAVMGPIVRKKLTPVLLEGQRKVYGDAAASLVLTPEQETAIWESTKASFDEIYRDVEELREPTYADFALASMFWAVRMTFGRDSTQWKEVSTEWARGRIGKVSDVVEGYESTQL
ncbi:hypothetical protein Moror_10921 [Moniliophthora roreri MCA 2997]|uniref:GST N-terminal domain-containing protein n=2 Tax=Moniliophthora roreri TaxID=221103 RepID=V2X2I5_MONRO|nr:hypothetical protein Moror_10921 [Moniliophthora roreri MCA 2997]